MLAVSVNRQNAPWSRLTSLTDNLLRLPLLWGALAYLGVYALIHEGVLRHPLVERYLTSHPVEHVTTALFLVGLAALGMKLFDVVFQFTSLDRRVLEPVPHGGQPPERAPELQRQLGEVSESLQDTYLVRRLREAIEFVRRKRSADTLDDKLRYLEELDLARMHTSYATVRIIVWAIPILGFLGTVIGITMAIAKLSPEALENSLPEVTSALGLAFDTTTLALTLSILLMFAKFAVERVETRLLAAVDARVAEELVGRFHQYGTGDDPQLAAVRRMSERVVDTVQQATQSQIQLWQSAFDETRQHLKDTVAGLGGVLSDRFDDAISGGLEAHARTLNDGLDQHTASLTGSLRLHFAQLSEGIEEHVSRLTECESEIATENRRHLADVEAAVGEAVLTSAERQERLVERTEQVLQEMQVALVESASCTISHQEELVKQSDVLLKVVTATSEVRKLEDALNQNLSTLAGAHHFEETLMSLSAAVQLLSARLGQTPAPAPNALFTSRDEPSSNAA